MKIIGLTGGIACGKTAVAGMLHSLGASVVDADEISRELTMPGGEALPALYDTFGSLVFYPDGTLNRPVLAALVFENSEELEKLNGIMHPMIHQKLLAQIEICRKMGVLVVVLDVPLLFEAGVEALADITLCASVSEQRQIERLQTRSGLTCKQAMSRIRSQWPLAEKEKRSDIVLDTDKSFSQLQVDVQKLYNGWIAS